MRAKENCYPEKSLYEELVHACKLADGRRAQGRRHQMVTVVILLVMGYMMGKTTYRAIDRLFHSENEKAKIEAILKSYFELPHGIPHHYIFSRVLAKADPVELTCTVADFIFQLISHDEDAPLPHICIDGKANRAAENKAVTGKSLYIVNVVYAAYKLLLYHMKVGPKTQESKSIEAEISDILFGAPAIVTMDAMGTRKHLLDLIVAAGGEAIMPVKSNNRKLVDLLREYIIQTICDTPELVESKLEIGPYTAEDKPSSILPDVRCNWFEEDNRKEENSTEEMAIDSFVFFDNVYHYPKVCQTTDHTVIPLELDEKNRTLAAVNVNGRWITLVNVHGRYERREYELLSDKDAFLALKDNPVLDEWGGVQLVGMVTRYRATQCRDKETKKTYYALTITRTPYILSANKTIGEFAEIVRQHWEVEQFNNTMDTIFDEDHCKTRVLHGPENCSLMKKLAYNLIQIRRKQESLKGNDMTFTEAMALFSPSHLLQSIKAICDMFTNRICSPFIVAESL